MRPCRLRRVRVSAIASITVLAALAGCGVRREAPVSRAVDRAPVAVASSAGTLAVFAPPALAPVIEAVSREFGAQNAGASLVYQVLPDNEPAEKVLGRRAGPGVLLMTDGPRLARLREAMDVGSGEHVAGLDVVVAARKGNPLKVKAAVDLSGPKRAALCVPDASMDAAGATFRRWVELQRLPTDATRAFTSVANEAAACEAVRRSEADLAVTYAPRAILGEYADDLCVAFYLDRHTAPAVKVIAFRLGEADSLASSYISYLTASRGQAAFRRCGLEPAHEPSPTDAEKSLFIPCGAGLQPAMDRLADTYFDRTGVRADFCYAGSGMLLAQLNFTRRGDLYMPGEGFWVTLAERRGFVGTKVPVVYFVPVIGVPKGNPKNVQSLADLARPGVRVCMGDPEALAVGPVTVHILERAGLLEKVKHNVAMMCGCIPELANAIAMKSADAGIIWDAVAYQFEKDIEGIEIPVKYNEAAEVLISTLTVSRQPDEARRFMEFVASDEAAQVFREHGFRTERPEGMRLAPQDAPGG